MDISTRACNAERIRGRSVCLGGSEVGLCGSLQLTLRSIIGSVTSQVGGGDSIVPGNELPPLPHWPLRIVPT